MTKEFSTAAKDGMVVSSQSIATLAGVEILMKSRDAIDAAIAVAVVLGVIEPSSIGVGSAEQHRDGGLVATNRDRSACGIGCLV
jgi:gamma-glutamyltranspeptidase